ncbi:MAG: hypothetical protein US68_C0017G0008 [Candidatus Shapirobacteria bacterium GW2011_GWE1_38_10]|uniref:Uncharacterized protein n=1 Tax=Candidatus Shapirobacteria bacterium GW2011_GWE1_38_10 TaxID=1618488 RepID=A0A0G0I3V9_9BACT|nr:MAG: hypothetical protein US46_C0004G0095 [Candidatus Shapirobacteria bacterium GW2011_GWF2_37_20]KKQ49227.1 MAG: hypothetical protein US68_C0017G0008 [Candidatus Shapirobacteria bacterium GW2011_GWE1_38_10]KKQ62873.1 MAG: hypothetical protein US85_C0021G0002 [Candidatus Shapirobacteria bacterium GW2011_GWF1_38_23]
MSEKLSPQPKFFYKIENSRINDLKDEFNNAFIPEATLPQARIDKLK